jgi:hypothetical protein
MHLQVPEREEKEGNTRARSLALSDRARPGVVWHGEARQWAWVHDVRVNSLPKSDAKPRMPVTSFCHLFLL